MFIHCLFDVVYFLKILLIQYIGECRSGSVFCLLQVENPSCLWGRVIRSQGGDSETTEEYFKLLAQINLFYNDVTQDLSKLKPTSLDEGQVKQHLQSVFISIFTCSSLETLCLESESN